MKTKPCSFIEALQANETKAVTHNMTTFPIEIGELKKSKQHLHLLMSLDWEIIDELNVVQKNRGDMKSLEEIKQEKAVKIYERLKEDESVIHAKMWYKQGFDDGVKAAEERAKVLVHALTKIKSTGYHSPDLMHTYILETLENYKKSTE